LNAGCMVSVAKEAGQAADSILYQNVLKMSSRLMASSRPNSIWIINQDCEPQLHQMSLAVGAGGSTVYTPMGGASQAPYQTLFGRPVVPIEQCPVVGDTGDIMLCDFSKYIAIDKGGIQSDVSIHVQFKYDEQVFRFVYRFDGQPMLASAISPFSGGDDLSHFVKLAERA
jgi:HK97 family phage major capsid protein